jgi:hypothetical protein
MFVQFLGISTKTYQKYFRKSKSCVFLKFENVCEIGELVEKERHVLVETELSQVQNHSKKNECKRSSSNDATQSSNRINKGCTSESGTWYEQFYGIGSQKQIPLRIIIKVLRDLSISIHHECYDRPLKVNLLNLEQFDC